MQKVKKVFLKFTKKRFLTDVFLIVIGSFISALSYSLFLIHLRIVPGGVSGISMILNYLFKTPVGILIFILNIPLLMIGWKHLGRTFALRTIIGLILSSLLIDFQVYILKFPMITDDMILGTIFGGILLGLGLGLIFLGNASTGGTDVIGQMVNKYTNFSTGTGIMFIDIIIISIAAIVFQKIEAALYGYICLYISSKVIDFILEGSDYVRGAFVMTFKHEEISEAILSEMNRGATLLNGKSVFQNREIKVIFSVVTKKEIPRLRRLVKEIDPNSFMVITEVHEVLGRGFKRRVREITGGE